MPPSAIAGNRVNRECYMQVRGYGCTTPALVPFCVARLKTIRHTGRLRTLPAQTGSRLTAPGHHTGTPDATRAGFDLPENEFIAERTFRI